MSLKSINFSISSTDHEDAEAFLEYADTFTKAINAVSSPNGEKFEAIVAPITISLPAVRLALQRHLSSIFDDAIGYDKQAKTFDDWVKVGYERRLLKLCNTPCSQFKV